MLGKQLHTIRHKDFEFVEKEVYPIHNNRFVKANGGLWTSSYNEEYGSEWVRWCMSEGFCVPKNNIWHGVILTPSTDANILVIDSLVDLIEIHRKYMLENEKDMPFLMEFLDYEKIAMDYDAMHLTSKGQWETRLSMPSLYGWDVESTHWFRWKFDSVERITWIEGDKTNEYTSIIKRK